MVWGVRGEYLRVCVFGGTYWPGGVIAYNTIWEPAILSTTSKTQQRAYIETIPIATYIIFTITTPLPQIPCSEANLIPDKSSLS